MAGTEDIQERARNPRWKGFEGHGLAIEGVDSAIRRGAGDNPFCGDSIEVRLRLAPDGAGGQRIEEAAFDGYACTLCTAAADALLEHVCGMRPEEARAVTYNDLLALLGSPTVGRTRSGCVRLPLTILARALG